MTSQEDDQNSESPLELSGLRRAAPGIEQSIEKTKADSLSEREEDYVLLNPEDYYDSPRKYNEYIENKRLVEQIRFRKLYSERIYNLLVVWLSIVMVIVIVQGIQIRSLRKYVNFELPPPVVVTLLGGATVNMIGLFGIVANYFFSKTTSSIDKAKAETKKEEGKDS